MLRIPDYYIEVVHDVMPLSEVLPWGVEMVKAPAAWQHSKGKGVVAAILDTGCWRAHPELRDALIQDFRDYSNISDPAGGQGPDAVWAPIPDTDPYDGNGHGTHVCGIIGARQNGEGIVGVAPEAKLLAWRVFGPSGTGDEYAISLALLDVAAARQAWNDNPNVGWPIAVVNCSFGSNSDHPAMRMATKACFDAGIVVSCAAGNSGDASADNPDTVNYPARYEWCESIVAVDSSKMRPWFSSQGGENDYAAPGAGVPSTWMQNGYATISGTSMAAPHFSGLVCLVQGWALATLSRMLTHAELDAVLASGVEDLGVAGTDHSFGLGLATMAVNWPDPAPTPRPEPVPEPIMEHEARLTIDNLTMYVDGRPVTLDVAPLLVTVMADGTPKSRTLVPLRAVAEGLGATVSWDPATRTVTLRR